MQLTSVTAQHSMEHAMSAYHPSLPHSVGLIMISKAFAEFFIAKHACDGQFIKMAKAMSISNADKPEDFVTALVKLQEVCGCTFDGPADGESAFKECSNVTAGEPELLAS